MKNPGLSAGARVYKSLTTKRLTGFLGSLFGASRKLGKNCRAPLFRWAPAPVSIVSTTRAPLLMIVLLLLLNPIPGRRSARTTRARMIRLPALSFPLPHPDDSATYDSAPPPPGILSNSMQYSAAAVAGQVGHLCPAFPDPVAAKVMSLISLVRPSADHNPLIHRLTIDVQHLNPVGPRGPTHPFLVLDRFFMFGLVVPNSALSVPLRLTACLHRDHLTHWNQWVPPAKLRPRHRNGARNSFRFGFPEFVSAKLSLGLVVNIPRSFLCPNTPENLERHLTNLTSIIYNYEKSRPSRREALSQLIEPQSLD